MVYLQVGSLAIEAATMPIESAVIHFGSPEMQERVVPPVLRGEKRICLAISMSSSPMMIKLTVVQLSLLLEAMLLTLLRSRRRLRMESITLSMVKRSVHHWLFSSSY